MNAAASSAKSAQIWSKGYKPVKKDLKGLYHYTFSTAGGLVIECYLEYTKEERATFYCPGNPEDIELIWATVGRIDISEVLEDIRPVIEEEALEDISKKAKESKDDAAIDAYESRRDDERMGY